MTPTARNAAKLAAFSAVLAVVFGVALLAGDAVYDRGEPGGADGATTRPDRGRQARAEERSTMSTTHTPGNADHPVRGLAVADDGLQLVVDDPELRSGRHERLRFRIVDATGRTVRDFDVEHEKRMHVIVARRDLTAFQHLHPVQEADGAWSLPLRLDEAGSYRLFADFFRESESRTLGTDLRVDGRAELRPLPAPRTTAVSDGGYDVRLAASGLRPGREAQLRFSVAQDGVPVRTQPYLGAGGHLVALRDGDLAFLHVHPVEVGHHASTGDEREDGAVRFAATFPTAGHYRLFLQFRHADRIHTVAFTQAVR